MKLLDLASIGRSTRFLWALLLVACESGPQTATGDPEGYCSAHSLPCTELSIRGAEFGVDRETSQHECDFTECGTFESIAPAPGSLLEVAYQASYTFDRGSVVLQFDYFEEDPNGGILLESTGTLTNLSGDVVMIPIRGRYAQEVSFVGIDFVGEAQGYTLSGFVWLPDSGGAAGTQN